MIRAINPLARLPSALVFFVTCTTCCWGAFEHMVIGARPAGMGGAYVALADDPGALFWNSAGLEQIAGRMFSAFVSRPFGVEDLSLSSMGYIQLTPWGRWGVSLRTFGTNVYRETTCGLSHSRKIRKEFCVGATLKFFNLSIDRYGSAYACGIDVGCLYEMKRHVYGGLSITNVNTPHIGEVHEHIPSLISIGLRSHPGDEYILTVEVQKETGYGIQFHTGQEYRFSKVFALRTGLQTNPTDFTAGTGFYFGRYRLDYAFSSHSVLGFTHQASITVR